MKHIGVFSTKILFAVAGGLLTLLAVSTFDRTEVHAAGVTTEGSHSVEITRDGTGTVCSSDRPRIPVDFSLQVTNVDLDVTTGEISYKTKVSWRRCQTGGTNRQDTRAYAIFGGKYCEMSGWYGGSMPNNTDAYDCTKYVGSPPYIGSSGLTCNRSPHGTRNADCLTAYGRRVIREENQPSPSSDTTISTFSKTIKVSDNWNTHKTRNSSHTVSLGNLCQYFKHGSGFSNTTNGTNRQWRHCVQAKITVRWTYTPPLEYSIVPTVNSVSPLKYSYYNRANVQWSARVTNLSGGTMSSIGSRDVDLWRIVYAPGVSVPGSGRSSNDTTCPVTNGHQSCVRVSNFTASNTSGANPPGARRLHLTTRADSSSGPDAPGTRTCYIARVKNPTHASTDDNVWRYSDIVCTVAGIKPKIQVRGGDVKSTGMIETSWVDVQSRRFGSWGEYGVLSRQSNYAMGSGATLGLSTTLNMSPQSSWSNLTFKNTNNTYGDYGGTLSHTEISRTGAAEYSSSRSIGSIDELLGAGNRRVIAVNGTLTITGDLVYPNEATTINDIPRIILIANDIVIKNTVRRIDPWLVAKRLSTCDHDRVAGFQSMTSAGLLDSTICNRPLTFNGPVIADKVYLYRTYDTVNGDAAETFNLRADALLSSYVGRPLENPIATTGVVKELSPRF